jgi:hypothetical protein
MLFQKGVSTVVQNSEPIDLRHYYTAKEAAQVLSANSGKTIRPFYLRVLARYGVLTPIKMGAINLYPKSQVDTYRVEERGAKLEHHRQGRAKKLKRGPKSTKEAA